MVKVNDTVRVQGYYGRGTVLLIDGKSARVQFTGRLTFSIMVPLSKCTVVK